MENFEELIKNYVIKKVDDTNPSIVTYDLIRRPRVSVIDLRNGVELLKDPTEKKAATYKPYNPEIKQGRIPRGVRTPYGVFSTVREAAKHIGLTPAAVYHKLKQNLKKEIKEYELL